MANVPAYFFALRMGIVWDRQLEDGALLGRRPMVTPPRLTSARLLRGISWSWTGRDGPWQTSSLTNCRDDWSALDPIKFFLGHGHARVSRSTTIGRSSSCCPYNRQTDTIHRRQFTSDLEPDDSSSKLRLRKRKSERPGAAPASQVQLKQSGVGYRQLEVALS